MTQEPTLCPVCGSRKTIQIVYDSSDGSTTGKRRRALVPKDCVIDETCPDYNCKACGHQFQTG